MDLVRFGLNLDGFFGSSSCHLSFNYSKLARGRLEVVEGKRRVLTSQ